MSDTVKICLAVVGGLVVGGVGVFMYVIFAFDRAWRRNH